MGKVNAIAEHLEQAVIEGQAYFDALKKSGNSLDVIREYVRVDEEYERLDKARKALYALLEGISRNVIPEMLQEQQMRTVSLEDIKRRITVSTRISCSILPEKKLDAYNWLRDPQQDAGALIQETVNAGTLSSFAKQRMEELGLEMPEGLFKMSSMQYTSVTKIK